MSMKPASARSAARASRSLASGSAAPSPAWRPKSAAPATPATDTSRVDTPPSSASTPRLSRSAAGHPATHPTRTRPLSATTTITSTTAHAAKPKTATTPTVPRARTASQSHKRNSTAPASKPAASKQPSNGSAKPQAMDPSTRFMSMLNSNATKIQRWYRSIMRPRNPSSLSILPTTLDSSKMETHGKMDSNAMDADVATRQRRQRLADLARQEIMREIINEQQQQQQQIAPSAEPATRYQDECSSEHHTGPIVDPQAITHQIDLDGMMSDDERVEQIRAKYAALFAGQSAEHSHFIGNHDGHPQGQSRIDHSATTAGASVDTKDDCSVAEYDYGYEDDFEQTDTETLDSHTDASSTIRFTTQDSPCKTLGPQATQQPAEPRLRQQRQLQEQARPASAASVASASATEILAHQSFLGIVASPSPSTPLRQSLPPVPVAPTQREAFHPFECLGQGIHPQPALSLPPIGNPTQPHSTHQPPQPQPQSHVPAYKPFTEYRMDLGKFPADPSPSLQARLVSPPAITQASSSSAASTVPSSVQVDDNATATRRVDRILDYLKAVEEEDRQSLKAPSQPASMSGAKASRHDPVAVMAEFLKDTSSTAKTAPPATTTEATTAVFEGVKAKIMGQQLEIEDKTKTIDMLKMELKKLKEMIKDQASQHQKTLKSQMSLQRKEYETIIKRHLTFIDKVLAEKEELSKKCEELAGDVKQLEKQYSDKAKSLEETHSRDIKQQREMWMAAEKIKRDKWIQEKTKSIKDQTVKGLEPEIQRMIAQHKAQVRDLEEKFREQMVKEKTLMAEQQQRQLDTMRDKSIAERQKACEDEREFARQRYQKQLERDEMEFQQQKRKLLAEFDEQKHHMIESVKEERKMDESNHRKALDELRRQNDAERVAREQAAEEVRKKHQSELHQLREKLQVEKEEWQSHYMKKVEAEIRVKEKQFKERLIKERDAEIEMVIQRLESESNSSTSDATRKYRMDIERMKSETAEEVKHLRDQHSMALDKVLSAQSAINQLEDHRRQLQKDILQLQHEVAAKDATVRQQKHELSRLKVDEQTLINTIRREFNEQLDAKELAIQHLSDQMGMLHEQTDVLRRKYQQEIDAIVKDKDASMMQIEDRVKQALRQKDEMIASLKAQQEELLIRNGHLETLMEKQRHELLG